MQPDTAWVEAGQTEPEESVAPRRRRHARKSVNILAILALILAVVASPLAMIFGYVAIGQIRRSDQRGATMAWLAIGLGWLWTAAFVVVLGALGTIWWQNPFWP